MIDVGDCNQTKKLRLATAAICLFVTFFPSCLFFSFSFNLLEFQGKQVPSCIQPWQESGDNFYLIV